ncbi:MAG: biotin/lipoyl-binding protein, partial [Gammaproteobacteria bacterium]|nr:biotin/lipoyl-binding protein [Gammaproteobacteria bacterium]
MREFKLPDLGEGLTEAEIVEWHVAANDDIKLNQPLVSVETDKAVVEVPSPVTGRVISLHGEDGDVIPVGDVLARFDVPAKEGAASPGSEDAPASEDVPGREDAPGREDVPSSQSKEDAPTPQADGKDDAPGVVGALPASALVMSDTTGAAAAAPKKQRVKAAPSVRALARELGVDLTRIEGSGPGGRITARDVAGAAKAAGDAAPPSPGPKGMHAPTGGAPQGA